MPTTTETRVNDLIINKMSKAQFDALQEKSPTELYIVEGDSNAIYAEQITALPTAAEGNLGKVYQYIGATDANYTNGYFYKCVSDGASTPTYSWENIEVQPAGDSLPDQTGQAGKFLTTDGTDASWSDKPLVNNTTSNGSLQILGTGTTTSQCICIGVGANSIQTNCIAIGNNSFINGTTGALGSNVAVGNNAQIYGKNQTFIGSFAIDTYNSNAQYCIGIGTYACTSGAVKGAIQIGKGTNSESGTVYVGQTTDGTNFTNTKLLDSDGTIPEARLADTTGATQGQVLTLDANGNAEWATPSSGGGVPTLTWYTISTAGNTLTIADTSSAQLVKVYKNGLLLQPTEDYTISGTTLTTVSAMVVGDKITTEVF